MTENAAETETETETTAEDCTEDDDDDIVDDDVGVAGTAAALMSGPGQLFELLLTTAHRLATEMHAELALDQMSTLQLVGLRMLARATEPVTAKWLAKCLAITKQSAAELVHRLVRDGYVEQVEARHDRRRKILVPTAAGRFAATLAADALERCVASFTRSFTEEERATFITLLERLWRGGDLHRVERTWGVHGSRRPPRPGQPFLHVR
jgi:DNA-binding MarR family transcriptional regulator